MAHDEKGENGAPIILTFFFAKKNIRVTVAVCCNCDRCACFLPKTSTLIHVFVVQWNTRKRTLWDYAESLILRGFQVIYGKSFLEYIF